jgi:probable HAF family extracellular repeat protein
VGVHGGVQKVNVRGEVLATFTVGGRDRSFVWRSGHLTDLSPMVATDINDHGQVVGRITRRNGTFEAVRWERGRIVALGTLPGDTGSSAVAINEQGQIVGTSWGALTAVRGRERVFVWEDGSMSDLGSLIRNAARETVDVLGINERGDVAGDQVVSYNTRHCFLWRDGTMADLGTLGGRFCKVTGWNDRGQVVGWSRLKAGPEAQPASAVFVSADGRLTPVARGIGILTSINNRGQIALDTAVWEGGTITALPRIGAGSILAEAINDRGQIVGGTLAPDGDDHALLWTPVSG